MVVRKGFTSSSALTSALRKLSVGCSGRNWWKYQALRDSTYVQAGPPNTDFFKKVNNGNNHLIQTKTN